MRDLLGIQPKVKGEKLKLSRKEKKEYKAHLKEQVALAKAELEDAKADLARLKEDAERMSKGVSLALQANQESTLDELKKQKINRRDPDILDFIKYEAMFEDGICMIDEHSKSVMLSFTDISYQDIPEESQEAIHNEISKIYDGADESTIIQRLITNTPFLEDEIKDRIYYDPSAQQVKNAEIDADLYNQIIGKKVQEGVSNIERGLHYIITVRAENLEQSINALASIRATVQERLSSIKSRTAVLDGKERLKIAHSLLRPFKPLNFSYDQDIYAESTQTTKDAIAPYTILWGPNGEDDIFKTDGVYGRVMALRIPDGDLNDRAFSDIAKLPIPLAISDFSYPIDRTKSITKVRADLADLHVRFRKEERRNFRAGNTFRPGIEDERTEDALKNSLSQQQEGGQRLFGWAGYVYTYAKSLEELDKQTLQIIAAAKSNSVEVEALALRQPQALNSVLPFGKNYLPISRVLTTAQVAMPSMFATAELNHRKMGSIWLGQHRKSNNLILADLNNRAFFPSGMIFASGPAGTGKSFIIQVLTSGIYFSSPTTQIVFVDRKSEYVPFVKRYGGTIIKPAVGTTTHFNPLDLSDAGILRGESLESQIAFKIDAMIAQAAASAEANGRLLSDEERSIISRCVDLAYRPLKKHYEQTGSLEGVKSPLLEDFYNLLGEQKEDVARDLQLRYERFVTGSMNFYNNHSNVDWSARMINIDLSETLTDATIFSLINACEAVRNLAYANSAQGKRTVVVLEELQALMKFPAVLNYFSRLVNEGRSYGLTIVGVTQIPDAILDNEDARNIILNADLLILLKQSLESRHRWKHLLGLGSAELENIGDGTPRGSGLLVASGLGLRVPFKGEFPQDNHLFELYDSDPEAAKNRKALFKAKPSKKNLSAKKIAELQAMAKALGIDLPEKRIAKAELIEAILGHYDAKGSKRQAV